MKAILITLAICLGCIATSAPIAQARARSEHRLHRAKPNLAAVYELQQIRIADSIPAEYVWAIYDKRGTMLGPDYDGNGHILGLGGTGIVYKSLNSFALRQWVGYLSAGSTIQSAFSGSPFPIWVSPKQGIPQKQDILPKQAIPSKQPISSDLFEMGTPEVKEFAHFCRSRGVHFVSYARGA